MRGFHSRLCGPSCSPCTRHLAGVRTSSTLLALVLLAGCASSSGTGKPLQNVGGVQARDLDVGSKGLVTGVGIEGHDVVSMTKRMARDLLAADFHASLAGPPRVIIDGEYFSNEGSQIVNKRLITDRLRVELNRAAAGRMVFVGRHYAGMVAHERELKREGVTDIGTIGLTKAQAGGDFRLGGTIGTLDSRDPNTGIVQRYNQIVFELVDLETGVLVWTNLYEFQRAAADDVIYR